MAENKKSFVLYCDYISVFEQLTDKEAGSLIKHILRYVNDQSPASKNRIVNMAFEPIKLQLKRDLRIWEAERSKRSEAGKKGGIKSGESRRAGSKRSSASKNEANEGDTVTVNVTVTDTVTDLSEIEIGATIQFCSFSLNRDYDKKRVVELWQAFLINGQEKNYTGRAKKIKHFRNWIKTQPHETHKRTIPGSNGKLGTSEARIERAKNWPAR